MLQVVVLIFYIDAFSTLQMLLQRFLLIFYRCVTALYLNSYYAAILLLFKIIYICFVASHILLLLIKCLRTKMFVIVMSWADVRVGQPLIERWQSPTARQWTNHIKIPSFVTSLVLQSGMENRMQRTLGRNVSCWVVMTKICAYLFTRILYFTSFHIFTDRYISWHSLDREWW